MSLIAVSLVILALCFCCLGPASVVDARQLSSHENTDLERFIREAIRCSGAQSASVALVRDGHTVYSHGHGQSNPTVNSPVDTNTTFCIGGLTKAFSSVLLAHLIDIKNSSVTFDTPIRDILGLNFWLSERYRSEHVSLRDILTQKTGISNMEAISQMNSIKIEDLMKHFMYSPEAYNFRERVFESDLLFLVVEKVAEKLGGKPYQELLKKYILEPLGMSSTTFIHKLSSGQRNLAIPTMQSSNRHYSIPIEVMRGFKLTKAANGICSTATDMAKWLNIHLRKGMSYQNRKTIIRPKVLQETYRSDISRFTDAFNLEKNLFLQPAVSVSFAREGYGMGWETGYYRGFELRTHGGSIPGYESMLSILPNRRVGVYIVFTGIGGSKSTVIKTLFNAFALDLLMNSASWINYTNLCQVLDNLVANLERNAHQSRPTFTPHIWREEYAETNPNQKKQKNLKLEIYASTYRNRMFGDVHVRYNKSSNKLSLSYGKKGYYDLSRTTTKDIFITKALDGLPRYTNNADEYQANLFRYLYFNRTSSAAKDTHSSIKSVTIPDFDRNIHPVFRKKLKPINMVERYGPMVLSSQPALHHHFLALLSCVLSSIFYSTLLH